MTTIDTIDDLLRLVREDEEVRAALRREVPTEELRIPPSGTSSPKRTSSHSTPSPLT